MATRNRRIEYYEGRDDYAEGMHSGRNPYDPASQEYDDWRAGWEDAHDEDHDLDADQYPN